ncbi:MAG: DUF4336 domain-containing protein [Leptolyngbya sp. SIO1E4]|nr:DUF4336 domain-containing protein [Leptolyngbya sp. SIO1E4]
MSLLQPFGDRIWICNGPRVRMMTIPFATRMTIIELEPGNLWVHSPLEPTSEVQKAVEALGNVKFIVAPNKIHSLGVRPWKAQYPSADVWVSPRFQERHPSIPIGHVIGIDDASQAWGSEIDTLCFGGSSFFDEVIFYHRRSGTLILTDLIQRHDPAEESWFWRFVKRTVGVLGSSGGTAKDLRSTFGDLDAARASVEALLRWDFDRVVIAHGMCITEDAHHTVEKAFDWALKTD